MNETLRPSTLGEILDRTANLYRSRFLVYFGLASLPAAVVLGFGGAAVLLFAWAGTSGPDVGIAVSFGVVALSMVALPLLLGTNALSGAALCHAASTQALGGTISISSAFKAVWRRGWQYVGLYLLEVLIIVGVPFAVWTVLVIIVAVLATVAARGSSAAAFLPGALMVLMMLGISVYAVWMLLRLCLAFPIAVVERAGVGSALKRAWTLSNGTRWRMLVLFILGMALGWVGSLLVTVPLFIVVAVVPALNSPQHAQLAGMVVLIGFYGASFAMQALTMPVYAIALVLFYYDQRVRQEGFDIELLMQEAGMIVEPPAQPEPAPWMLPVVREEHAETGTPAVVENPGDRQIAPLAQIPAPTQTETTPERAEGTI